MTTIRYCARRTGWMLGAFLLVAALPQSALAGWCWNYSNVAASNPLPWIDDCNDGNDDDFPAGSTAGQLIRNEHRNWHCTNCIPGVNMFCSASGHVADTPANQKAYGRAFLAFHRQLILDFDNYRLDPANHVEYLGKLDIWDPFAGAAVPGDDESTTDPFRHCSSCITDDTTICEETSIFTRAAGATCTSCENLPASLTTGLGGFTNLGDLGYELEREWHGSYHVGVSSITPGCGDIGGFNMTTRDPAFWMAHKKLDEVVRDWQTLQAADVVLVIDRSGSMDDNCSSSTPPPGESPCAINDARESARAFADLIGDSGGHNIAVVSFSDAATPDLAALTPATGIVTDNAMDDTAFELAIAGISSGGFTSIGSGIQEAISILGGGGNPHQAILVLTDGKENTTPCLISGASDCSGAEVAESAYGDTQVVAIGFGAGAEETALRTVSERHGGSFIAQQNLVDAMSDLDPNKLLKFYVNAFGEIFDSAASVDPDGVMLPGQMASAPFPVNVCGENEFTVFLGREAYPNHTGGPEQCDLKLEIFSPAGAMVDRLAPEVEDGHGPRYDFVRVRLPYNGESTGEWSARVVRPAAGQCESQRYFYSVMTPGLGRVKPFPLKPKLAVGQELTASFRLTESFNPYNHWDEISGRVVVTDPQGNATLYPLHDDGSNGDQTAGNNTWVVQVPGAVSVQGAYHLHALFDLKRNGCTTTREASYAIIAERQPDVCANFAMAPLLESQAGSSGQLDELGCVWNTCSDDEVYQVTVSDSQGWLLTEDSEGQLVPANGTYPTASIAPGEHICFGGASGNPGDLPFYLSIPNDAQVGEESIVQINLRTVTGSVDLDRDTTVRVWPLPDCNRNGTHDGADIEFGTSLDSNNNGIPDECPDEAMFGPNTLPQPVPALSSAWLASISGVLLLTGLLSLLALRRKRGRLE